MCLVWQTKTTSVRSQIDSRFNYTGTAWSRIIPVAYILFTDPNPSVAYDSKRNRWWCAFQNTEDESLEVNVYVSYGDSLNGWSVPVRVSPMDCVDDREPTIICDNDTIWVAWLAQYGEAINIHTRYYDGTSWSPILPVTRDSNGSNINQNFNIRKGNPFLVWEKSADIYYSEYSGGQWTIPRTVGVPSRPTESKPKVISYPGTGGIWIICHSAPVPPLFDIYQTPLDSFNRWIQIITHDSADVNPAGLFLSIPVQEQNPNCILWTSERDGNKNIYSQLFSMITSVDTSQAEDDSVVSSVVTYSGYGYLWAIWQTNRNGNWDIYGSYTQYRLGVKESVVELVNSINKIDINLNPVRGRVAIKYTISSDAIVELKFCDASGRVVHCIHRGRELKGIHQTFLEKRLSTGVYFVTLEANGKQATQKFVVVE